MAEVPIISAIPSIAAMLSISRPATANGQVSGARKRFITGRRVANSVRRLPRSAAGLSRELELGQSFLDAVGALQILQLPQLGGVAGCRRGQAAEAGLFRQDAIEHRTGIGDTVLALAAARGRSGGSTLADGVARAGSDVVAQRLFHLALLGDQRSDIAFELLAGVALIGERLLQNRHLVLDIELLFEPGAGQILASLAECRFDLAGQLLVIGVELVELGRR